MTVVLDSRRDFTLENFRRVTVDGEGIEIGPQGRKAMDDAHASFIAMLDQDRTQFVYGTTSMAGQDAKKAIPPEEQREHANRRRQMRRRGGLGFGGGYLDDRVVRGIVFARLSNYIEGNAKSRAVIAERIAAILDGPLPKVPMDGQVGAGEILPMAFVNAALPDGEYEEGEPMALGNGSPVSAALIADTALHARNRLEHAVAVFALAIESFEAPLQAYDPALEQLWDEEFEVEALRALNQNLEGAMTEGRRFYQAPVSYRILPRVLGQAFRAVSLVEKAAAASLRSVSDNPVYVLPDGEHPYGRAFSTGGYHNGMAYPAMQMLALAWADLMLLIERMTISMHRGDVSLLPDRLVRPGSDAWGSTGMSSWLAGGLLEQARVEASSAVLLPGTAHDAQNDIASPTFIAYGKERRVAELFDSALALLALVASQGLWVTEREPAPPLRDLLAAVRAVFPPVDDIEGGRATGEEAERLAAVFSEAALMGRLPAAVPA
jgi:histidine ammonia-lyase